MSRREQLLGFGDALPTALGPKVVDLDSLLAPAPKVEVLRDDAYRVVCVDGKLEADNLLPRYVSRQDRAMLRRDEAALEPQADVGNGDLTVASVYVSPPGGYIVANPVHLNADLEKTSANVGINRHCPVRSNDDN